MRKCLFLLFASLTVWQVPASANDRAARVVAAMQQADRVVVATVTAVQPRWHQNEWGDELIVSRTWIRAEETLKGPGAGRDLAVEIEGGTIDGVTLKVSDLPSVEPGERAIFLLKMTPRGELVLQHRGAGFLKLDHADRIAGAGLALHDVRNLARQIR